MVRNKGADSGETWAALLTAANELLMRDGISGLSLRRVARFAGHRLGTLQYYFPKKEALIETILGESYKVVRGHVQEVQASLAAGESVQDRSARMATAFYRAARQHRHLSRARITTNLVAGQMSGPSRKNLDGAAAMFSKQSGLDQDRLRIAIHMLSALSLRLASHSPEELKWLTGARTEEDAHRRVERMLSVVAAAAAADLGMAEERSE